MPSFRESIFSAVYEVLYFANCGLFGRRFAHFEVPKLKRQRPPASLVLSESVFSLRLLRLGNNVRLLILFRPIRLRCFTLTALKFLIMVRLDSRFRWMLALVGRRLVERNCANGIHQLWLVVVLGFVLVHILVRVLIAGRILFICFILRRVLLLTRTISSFRQGCLLVWLMGVLLVPLVWILISPCTLKSRMGPFLRSTAGSAILLIT